MNFYRYKSITLSIVFALLTTSLFCQESLLYKKIKETKERDIPFNIISSAFSTSNLEGISREHFISIEQVVALDYNKSISSQLSEAISLTIPIEKSEIQIELVQVPDSFYDYEIVTSDNKRYYSNKTVKHYRGVVKDDPKSLVAISFIEDEVMGLIATDKGNFNLMFNRQSGKHIFCNDKNLKSNIGFECGMRDDVSKVYDSKILQNDKSVLMSESKCVKLYFETEYDIFQARGSVSSVENFISGIFNQVSALYQNDGIETILSEVFVWTTPDPYTSTTTSGLLSQFQSNRTSFNGDLGQLLTFRTELGGGIAAGFNGICNTNVAQKLSVSMIYNSYLNIPNYSWTVQVITHEFGHLFGSRHTHACVWNGNNTAIDGCAGGTEGGCPLPGIPSGGGTIMSYCHLQSAGINFNLGFGIQPGNVIRNSVSSGICLCECVASITGPSHFCTTATYEIPNLPTGATVTWTATGSISISGANNVNPVSVTKTSNGTGILKAEISTSCGQTSITKNIFSGSIPVIPSVQSPSYIINSSNPQSITVKVNSTSSGSSYVSMYFPNVTNLAASVYLGSGAPLIINNQLHWTYPSSFSTAMLRVQYTAGCGETVYQHFTFYNATVYGYSYLIYPNPSNETLTISFENGDNKEGEKDMVSILSQIRSISLFNDKGREVRVSSIKPGETKVVLDTRDLPDGRYFLHIREGKEITKQQIIIEH